MLVSIVVQRRTSWNLYWPPADIRAGAGGRRARRTVARAASDAHTYDRQCRGLGDPLQSK